jgi:hypothetical protein
MTVHRHRAYDISASRIWLGSYAAFGWLAPLDDYIAAAQAATRNVDIDDFTSTSAFNK